MAFQVFIDGEAGTTGLQIRERLEKREDIRLIQLDAAVRKDVNARRDALNAADAAILCLPDDAAREAVALVENPATRVIDASTAFRTAAGWAYGFPEFRPGQREAIAGARFISNPGCYPTGFIALIAPLVAAGLVPASAQLTCNAVSGYSGGGKAMIAEFEDASAADYTTVPFRLYGLGLEHKHVPEMQAHCGLEQTPLFVPSVGRFAQGMIVQAPLQAAQRNAGASRRRIHEVLADSYAGAAFVSVMGLEEADALKTLPPETLNGTNRLELFVFGSERTGQVLLVARLDNLGKGASGAAVQNLNIALGVEETRGLI